LALSTTPLPDREPLHPQVGQRLRAARAKTGMTRKQLAVLSSTSVRYLAHLEAGTGNPTLSVMAALARALDLAVADLIPLGGERDARLAEITSGVRRLAPDRLDSLESWMAQNANLGGAKARRVVLIGLRGAGKSSLGRRVAERIGFPFFEISKEVEKAYGGAMGLLIELSGQQALRRHESEVWEDIIARNDRAVIAAPGGIVADGALYSRVLETAHSVWLEASPKDHMERVIQQGDLRPMAANRAAMHDLRAILEARSMDYARADARFNTSKQDFETSAQMLERAVRGLLQGL
jgi:XRE family transcriptional regulator, aerobic/anaerobic benzoate catabolism transcriptional regulator